MKTQDGEYFIGTERNVIKLSNEFGGRDPSAYDGTVAWIGSDGNYHQVFYWDGNSVTQITNNQQYDILSLSLYNSTIAWAQYHINDRFNRKIIYWDGTETHEIRIYPYNDLQGLSLYNGTIAWSGFDEHKALTVMIFFSGMEVPLLMYQTMVNPSS